MRRLTIFTQGDRVTVSPHMASTALWVVVVIAGIVAAATLPSAIELVRQAGKPGTAFYFTCFGLCFFSLSIFFIKGKDILPARLLFHNDRRQLEVVGRDGAAVLLPFERFTGFAVISDSLPGDRANQKWYQVALQRADGGTWMLGGYNVEARAKADVLRLEQAVRLAPPDAGSPGDPPPAGTVKRSPKVALEDTPMATTVSWRPMIRWVAGCGGTLFLGSFVMLFVAAFAQNVQWAVAAGGATTLVFWIRALSKHSRTLAVEVTRAHLRAFRPRGKDDLFRVDLQSVATVVSIFGASDSSTELYVLTGPQMRELQDRQSNGEAIVRTGYSIRNGYRIDTFEMTVAQSVHIEQRLMEAIERWRRPQGYREAPAEARKA